MDSSENDYVCPYRDSGLKMAREIEIDHYQALNLCLLRFPHATKFTFVDIDIEDNYLPIADFNRIVPLPQLNQLIIGWINLEPVQLIELLRHTLNVFSLELIWFSHLPSPSSYSEQVDNDYALINQNNVVQLTIRSTCNPEQVQCLINIFPRVKHLQLKIYYVHYQSIMKFLLLENRKNNSHLFSLSLTIIGRIPVTMEDVKPFIDDQKLLDNYSITISDMVFHIWW